MADGIIDNIFLVNAPAGSGKTTWIRHQVEAHLLKNPDDNILCITFTNRAATELGRDLESERVYFGTIHSFINDFISSFFSHSAIIDLYWETYKDKIEERIINAKQNAEWMKNNEKYKEKYGCIDLETVHSNLDSVSYNETPYTSLYRAALSHDDLISFTRLTVDRFPVIKKKIADKYQLVFIDEYQDTAADVLHIFYTSLVGQKSELYLLGDKMQQIYRNYNGEFEETFRRLNKSVNLSTNYRTTPKIVSILNAIYNDDALKQTSYERNSDDTMAFMPKVFIVSNMKQSILDFKERYSDAFVLYMSNKARFHDIGVGGLFDAYNKMEKYRYGRKYSAVDVLTKEEARSGDALLSFLFIVDRIASSYLLEQYGEVIGEIRRQKVYLNYDKYSIKVHSDKSILKSLIDKVTNAYGDKTMTINCFLELCLKEEFIKGEINSVIVEDSDYQFVKNVCVQEVRLLVEYMTDPKVSTQHGVKGESHDTVLFVAENSKNNPPVNMYGFLELWRNIDVTLSEFDAFYYAYIKMIQAVETLIGMKCSDLKAGVYSQVKNDIDAILQSFILQYASNPYYIHLLKSKMDKYDAKKGVINLKECLKENVVYAPLCAYRLFYVGCSRARKNLAIMISKEDVISFEDELRKKLQRIGFEVE